MKLIYLRKQHNGDKNDTLSLLQRTRTPTRTSCRGAGRHTWANRSGQIFPSSLSSSVDRLSQRTRQDCGQIAPCESNVSNPYCSERVTENTDTACHRAAARTTHCTTSKPAVATCLHTVAWLLAVTSPPLKRRNVRFFHLNGWIAQPRLWTEYQQRRCQFP